MKVVITGGAGFLGKKLARRILQQGGIAGPSGKPERGERAVAVRRRQGERPRPRRSPGQGPGRRHRQFRHRAVDRAGRRHGVPFRRRGQRRRRGRFRPRLPGQSRRHAQRAGSLPRARHQSARRLHQLAGGLRRRPAAGRDRRHGADAADLLWRAEVDRRVPDPRLHPQGISARHLGEAADDLRAHRPAQQGGLDLGHLGGARAADRRRRRLPGDARDHHGGARARARRSTPSCACTTCRPTPSARAARCC